VDTELTPMEKERMAAIIIIIITNDNRCSSHNTTLRQRLLLEIHKGRKTFYAASVYMDYNELIENNFQTLETILEFTEGAKLTIAMDSNARSTAWHDITTNRDKMMEFVASYQLLQSTKIVQGTLFKAAEGQVI